MHCGRDSGVLGTRSMDRGKGAGARWALRWRDATGRGAARCGASGRIRPLSRSEAPPPSAALHSLPGHSGAVLPLFCLSSLACPSGQE